MIRASIFLPTLHITNKNFKNVLFSCNDNEKVAQTPSSDEDNSPTELNSCKRLADKPPLVSKNHKNYKPNRIELSIKLRYQKNRKETS